MNRNHKKLLNPTAFKHSLFPYLLKESDLWDDLFPAKEELQDSQSNISLSEDKYKVYVEAALPGIHEDHIDVTLDKGNLWIEGKREESEEDSHKKYYCKAKGSYSYRIQLPESLDQNVNPSANFDKGMLSITFAKAQKEIPKKISVNAKF